MKKYISIILVVVLLISVISVTATTDEKTGIACSDMYYYAVNDVYSEPIITFEAEMNGSELLAFMNKFSVGKDFWDKIKEENRYIVTAFDW